MWNGCSLKEAQAAKELFCIGIHRREIMKRDSVETLQWRRSMALGSLHTVLSVTPGTQIYLRQTHRQLWWWTLTRSWLVARLFAPRPPPIGPSVNHLALMIFMCLRLCIVYHYSSSNSCSCLSFNIIISASFLPLKAPCLLLCSGSLLNHFSPVTGKLQSLPLPLLLLHSLPLLLSSFLLHALDLKPYECFRFLLCLQ